MSEADGEPPVDPAAPPPAVPEAPPADGSPADAPSRRRVPPWARVVGLLALGAALASAGWWIARRGPRAPAPAITLAGRDDGGWSPLPHDPALAPASKGPGDQRLTGVVVDGAGAPVAGAHVTAELELGAGDQAMAPRDAGVAPVVVAVCDAKGGFVLDGLIAGRHRLRIEGPELFTSEVRFVPVPSDEVRLVVARRVQVVGTVIDGAQPVRAAAIHLIGDAVGGERVLFSGADGSFTFDDLPEGAYQVWAVAGALAARAQTARRLGAGPFPSVALRLEPAAIVVGHVLEASRKDVAGGGIAALVVLTPAPGGGADAEPPRRTQSGADGLFRIEGIPHGRWTAEAWAPGWVASGSVEFDAGAGIPDVELVWGGVIEGTVVDGARRPIAGAELSARSTGATGEGREVSAAADADRLRQLAGLSPQLAKPVAGAGPALAADPHFVPKGELGVLLGPIPFPPAGPIGARPATIIDDVGASVGAGLAATPVGGAIAPPPLPVDPARAPIWTTGQDGRFRVTGLARGSWTLAARAAGFADGRSRALVVAPGDSLRDVAIVLSPGTFVVGTVRDQRGDPVIGATVALALRGTTDAASALGLDAITGLDGAFRVGPATGSIRISASAYGHGEVARELELDAPTDVAGEQHVDLVLVTADAVLEGALEDPTGLPVKHAQVIVASGPAAGRRVTTDDGGRFHLAQLPPGELPLRVEAPGFPDQELIATTATEARLRLVFGGGIEGLVFDHHTGEPIPGVAVVATGPKGRHVDAEAGVDGRLAIGPIPAGEWTLRIALPGYLPVRRTLTVPAGDRPAATTVTDLRLELERGALLAGIVVDRGGTRIAGARVTAQRPGDDDTRAEGKTDVDGAFRLHDVPTGDLEVTAEKDALYGKATLTLRAGDEYLSLQLELR